MSDEKASGRAPESAAIAANHSHRLLWFLLIPVLLVAFGLFRWLGDAHSKRVLAATTVAAQAEPVTVQQPQEGQPTMDLSLPATLQAFEDTPIYARTSGYVSHWYVDIGRHVQGGEVLATIASPEVDQQLTQSRAALRQSQANLALAQITTQRFQDLIKTNSVAQQQVDQNVQNLQLQQAAVVSSNANVNQLQQQQEYEKVTAPFSGIITTRNTNLGNLVNAGNNGLEMFRVSRTDIMRIFVSVPEEYSEQITAGLHAAVQLTELPGQSFEGRVARTNHLIDPNSRTLMVEVDVANPKGKLLTGAYGTVHFKLKVAARPLIVPSGAVLFQAAGPQVAVVTPDNKVELHKVGIGRDLGNTIEITSGLTPLDRIIATPPDYLVDGMPVTIENSQPTPAPQEN